MIPPPWYVITGGPCAGKTTLVKELERRGHRVVPESARAHIEEGLAAGDSLEEIRRDEIAFQYAVLDRKIAAEQTLPREQMLFLDRGMHDSAAYLESLGITSDPVLDAALRASSYSKVFLLDLFPFVQDDVRVESAATAADLHERLAKAYAQAGMPVIRVPIMPVSERADFVLANLEV